MSKVQTGFSCALKNGNTLPVITNVQQEYLLPCKTYLINCSTASAQVKSVCVPKPILQMTGVPPVFAGVQYSICDTSLLLYSKTSKHLMICVIYWPAHTTISDFNVDCKDGPQITFPISLLRSFSQPSSHLWQHFFL